MPTPAAHRSEPSSSSREPAAPRAEPPIDIQRLRSNNPVTWGDAMRQYEYEKRHVIHPDTLKGPDINIRLGMMKEQERVFDPIMQKYRDTDKEKGQRAIEERCRVQHLNRAKDIQLLRENNFDIVNNASKLSGLGDDIADKSMQPTKVGKRKFPDSFYDYNILSNLPVSIHHPDRPEARPLPAQKIPKQRTVPTFLQKDFNIVTNRYLKGHSDKTKRDYDLNLLEATAKHRTRNRMNPLTQRFIDPAEEDRFAAFQEAHEVEQVHRAFAQVPPTIKNRQAAFYNIVNPDEVHNADMVKWLDLAEDERKERYKNRYIDYHNKGVQDVRHDQITEERRMNKVHVDRFKEEVKRGFDIVTNEHHRGRNARPLYLPYSHEQPDPWTRSKVGTSDVRLHPAEDVMSAPGETRSSATAPGASAATASSPAKEAYYSSDYMPTGVAAATSNAQAPREVTYAASASNASDQSGVQQSVRSSQQRSARLDATAGHGKRQGTHQKSLQPASGRGGGGGGLHPDGAHAVQHNHMTVIKKMGIQPLNMTKVSRANLTMPVKAAPPAPMIPGSAAGSAVSVPVAY